VPAIPVPALQTPQRTAQSTVFNPTITNPPRFQQGQGNGRPQIQIQQQAPAQLSQNAQQFPQQTQQQFFQQPAFAGPMGVQSQSGAQTQSFRPQPLQADLASSAASLPQIASAIRNTVTNAEQMRSFEQQGHSPTAVGFSRGQEQGFPQQQPQSSAGNFGANVAGSNGVGNFGGQFGGSQAGAGIPFGKRKKRAPPTEPIIGSRFVINCVERGEAENEETDFINLCTMCWTWRQVSCPP